MQVLVVNFGEEKYAIEIGYIESVENMKPITKVPRAKKHIRGLMNLRGNIIPVLDYKLVNGIESNCEEKNLVIIKTQDDIFSVVVDDVHEVIDVYEENKEIVDGDTVINKDESVITFIDRSKIENLLTV